MIPFNKPHMTGAEISYITSAYQRSHLAGDGVFTKLCNRWIERNTGVKKALLTHSCTAALEMAAILAGVGPGDEIIMPSFTFVSTANAFVLRGATPVFIDIRADTLNLDERLIESAISQRTKAVVVVHYAGVACEMDPILAIARRHNLLVIEDAAQGVMATYKGRALGSIGDLGAYSFHETKNVISGEGGALLLRENMELVERAEIIREKGTNRKQFRRRIVDKYNWVDIGSSYLPSEIIAAFLWAQLEKAKEITVDRLAIWNTYHELLAGLEKEGLIQRPFVPLSCKHNAHMYYVLVPSPSERASTIGRMRENGVNPVFHYVPLHSSPAGQKFTRVASSMCNTDSLAGRLIRLPFWIGVNTDQVVEILSKSLRRTESSN